MTKALYSLALTIAFTPIASAITVEYDFVDTNLDETFEVFVTVSQGDNNGLATYNIALSGLDASPLDASTVDWEEGILSNLGADFVTRGFTSGLLESAVGTDAFSAANSQFQQTPFFGVGQVPVFQDAFDMAPDNFDVDLGVPALLGTILIPGANGLSDSELLALLSPNAAVFTGTDPGDVVSPDTILSEVIRIPEPSTVLLGSLALIGLAARRR